MRTHRVTSQKRIRKAFYKRCNSVEIITLILDLKIKGISLINFPEIEEFLKTCPEGLMTKRKFMDLSTLALGGKSEFLADALFRNLKNKTNKQ